MNRANVHSHMRTLSDAWMKVGPEMAQLQEEVSQGA